MIDSVCYGCQENYRTKTYKPSKQPKSTRRQPHLTRVQYAVAPLTGYESDSAIGRETSSGVLDQDREKQRKLPTLVREKEEELRQEDSDATISEMSQDTIGISAMKTLLLEDREKDREQRERDQLQRQRVQQQQ